MHAALKGARSLVFVTAAGVLILMQFLLLTAALDFITSLLLVGVGFWAGVSSKAS